MAVTTAAVAVAAGATVAAAQTQKKGAKEAAAQYDGIAYNPTTAARRVNRYMPVAFGDKRSFKDMQRMSNEIVLQNMRGQVSEQTQTMLGRQMLGTGAVDLGPGAVNQLYAGYLGMTQEEMRNQGVEQYRSLYAQYQQAVDRQASQQYSSEWNTATAKAQGISGAANATAGMWSGIAGIAGSVAGGGMGSGAGAGGGIGYQNMTMAGGNQFSGPSSMPAGWQMRNVSERPPGL